MRHALALLRQLDGVPRAHLERLDDQGIRPVEEESTEVIMLRRQPQRTSVDDGGGGFDSCEFPLNDPTFTERCFRFATEPQPQATSSRSRHRPASAAHVRDPRKDGRTWT